MEEGKDGRRKEEKGDEGQKGRIRMDLAAEYDGKSGKVRWEQKQDEVLNGFVNIDSIFGGRHGRGDRSLRPIEWVTAYAWTTINAPDERHVQIRFGSDDQAKIWLNGEEIFAYDQLRPAMIDQDIIPVTLKAGENTILVKVCDEEMFWGFYFRITDMAGVPFNDYRFGGEIVEN